MSAEKSSRHELSVTGAEGSDPKSNLNLALRVAKALLTEGGDAVIDNERETLKLRGTTEQIALIVVSCRDQCNLALAPATPAKFKERLMRLLRAPLETSGFRHGENQIRMRSDHDLE